MEYQKGRSFLEILAVLAIISVITITGLISLSFALTQTKAHQVYEEVKLIAFTAITDGLLQQMQLNEVRSTADILTTSFEQPDLFKETEKTFEILVFPLQEKICKRLINMHGEWFEEIIANEGEGCLEKENKVSFYINDNFTATIQNPNRFKSCQNDEDCGICGICRNNICVYKDTLCPEEKPYCIQGMCQPCSEGMFSNDGTCVSCYISSLAPFAEQETCQVCPNRYWTEINGKGYCLSCAYHGFDRALKEECLKCNNTQDKRYWNEKENFCYRCLGTPSADGTSCYWECPENSFGAESNCFDCSTASSFRASNLETCQRCDNRYFVPSGGNNYCLQCSYPHGDKTSRSECLRCNETENKRYWIDTNEENGPCYRCLGTPSEDGSNCIWTCPEGTFGTMNNCEDCQTTSYGQHSNEATCHQCPNRYFSSSSGNNYCFRCDYKGHENASQEACLRCNLTENKRYWHNGYCYPCTGDVTDGEECL